MYRLQAPLCTALGWTTRMRVERVNTHRTKPIHTSQVLQFSPGEESPKWRSARRATASLSVRLAGVPAGVIDRDTEGTDETDRPGYQPL